MFWKKTNKNKDPIKKPFPKPKGGKKIPSRQTLIRKLDEVFSLYVRLRDSKEFRFEYFRCPTCGKVKPFEQADCCHYVKRSCMALRWSEMNCHIGCRHCNRYLDGNLLEYRKWMVKKYGEQKVDLLEASRHRIKKWSAFELEEMIKYYKQQIDTIRNG